MSPFWRRSLKEFILRTFLICKDFLKSTKTLQNHTYDFLALLVTFAAMLWAKYILLASIHIAVTRIPKEILIILTLCSSIVYSVHGLQLEFCLMRKTAKSCWMIQNATYIQNWCLLRSGTSLCEDLFFIQFQRILCLLFCIVITIPCAFIWWPRNRKNVCGAMKNGMF